MDNNVAKVKAVYDAINRGDMDAVVADLDDSIVWIEPDYYPIGGTHRGRAAVRAHMEEARATWAEGACSPTDFVVFGGRIVVLAHVHVRLKTAQCSDGDIGDVYTFRDGKVIEMRHFPEPDDALAWARANESSEDTSGEQ